MERLGTRLPGLCKQVHRTKTELNSQGKAEAGLDRYQDGAIDDGRLIKTISITGDPNPMANDTKKAREDRRDLHRFIVTNQNLGWRRAR